MNLNTFGSIKSVSYYLISDDEVRKRSCVEVESSIITVDGKPAQNGVCAGRLGAIQQDEKCETCMQKAKKCPGHHGHIECAYPAKRPITLQDALDWINLICHTCSMPFMSEEDILKISKHKVDHYLTFKKKIKESSEDTICEYCALNDITSTKISVVPDTNKLVFLNAKTKEKIRNQDILTIFNKIPMRIIKLLHIEESYHPKNFIINVISVSPNNTRPETKKHGNNNSHSDDITKIYQMLIETKKKIIEVKDKIDDPDSLKKFDIYTETFDNMLYQLHFGNPESDAVNKFKTSNNKPLRSITENLKGKEGDIRDRAMGKKVQMIIRSVIVGEPDVQMGVVTIDKSRAMNMYSAIKVTPYNINEMLYYVENGKDVYPGCYGVKRGDSLFGIDIFKTKAKLQIGDVVLRHLIDGDWALFNRMPSLSWRSISGHQIKVLDDEWAIRFNENSCKPFNADFDGDDMNLYFVNGTVSKLETKHLSNIKNLGIDYQNGECTIGLKEDAILGLGLLTLYGVELDFKTAHRLFSQSTIRPDIKGFKRHPEFVGSVKPGYYSGRDIVSIALETMGIDINYTGKSKSFNKKYQEYLGRHDSDEVIVIKNGHMLSGVFDVSASKQGSFGTPFHLTFNKYGSSKANELSFNLQQIGLYYLIRRGFSIGIMDSCIRPEKMADIEKDIKDMIDRSVQWHHNYINNKIVPPINLTTEEYYEKEQCAILSPGEKFQDKIITSIYPDSALYFMISMGSKGNTEQMQKCIALSGQALVHNKRTPKECNNRSFIYATNQSYNPEDRGFIPNNLVTGFNRKNKNSDAQAERLGFIGKSQETAKGGYFGRQLTKSLENECVDNRYSVITGKEIVSLLYGGDGLDPRKQFSNKVSALLLSNKELEDKYRTTTSHVDKIYNNNTVKARLDEEYSLIVKSRDYLRTILTTSEVFEEDKVFDISFKIPINIVGTIENIRPELRGGRLDPIRALDSIQKLMLRIRYSITNEHIMNQKIELPSYIEEAYKKALSVIQINLCLRDILKNNLNNDNIDFICQTLFEDYYMSYITPGTTNGSIEAHSNSAAVTQGSLNSIHALDKKGLLPSIMDITHVRKPKKENDKEDSLTNPYIRFELKDGTDYNQFINDYEMKKMEYFIKTMTFMVRPLNQKDEDAELFKKHESMALKKVYTTDSCLRLELNKIELVIKGIDINSIVKRLYQHFNGFKIDKKPLEIYLVYGPMSNEKTILYIYISKLPMVPLNTLESEFIHHVKNCIVGGISGVIQMKKKTHKRSKINDDGSFEYVERPYIHTEGLNLDIIYNDERVKQETFVCNSLIDINKKFGILAAEHTIVTELRIQTGNSADIRHYINIAASMTFVGNPLPNSYHGIKIRYRDHVGLQMATEHFIDTIQDAVKYEKKHDIAGLSEPLLFATDIPSGTNFNKVIINHDFITSHQKEQNNEELFSF